MPTKVLSAAVLVMLSAGVVAAQKKLPDPRDPSVAAEDRLATLVKRVQLENKRISSMEAQFTQTKHSEMLLEPSKAHHERQACCQATV